MRLGHWTLALLLVTVLGCSDLILRETDSSAEKTGKVMTRVLICPLTLCFSELGIAQRKQDEQNQERYQSWFGNLSLEQQERERDRQAYQRGMAMQALGLGLMGGGPFRYHPTQRPTPTMQAPPLTCYSVPAGQTVMTQCR